MPQYFILKVRGRGRSQKVKIIGFTPNKKSIRAAWSYYKRNFRPDKNYTYHLFPINHSRYWEFENKKWVIESWYGNHKIQKQY